MNPILRVHLIIIEFFPFIQDPFGALWGALESFGNGFGRSFFALRRRAKFMDLFLRFLGFRVALGDPSDALWDSLDCFGHALRRSFFCPTP